MKEFRCSDVGLKCDWVVREETDSAIVEKALRHGKEVHNIEPTAEIASAVEKAIRGAQES